MTTAPPPDWQAVRRRTAAASSPCVHLNHASNSLPASATLAGMREVIDGEAEWGMHRAVARFEGELHAVHGHLGRLLGVRPHQVALVESASRGWAQALSAVAPQGRVVVLHGAHEWAANLMHLHRLPGVRSVQWMLRHGEPVAAAVTRTLAALPADGSARVVSLPLIDCLGRCTPDVGEVGAATHAAGGLLFVDGSQAVGQVPVDLTALGADVLVFSARKWLRGPRGIGALACSERALAALGNPVLLDIHGSRFDSGGERLRWHAGARRFEPFELHPALQIGLGVAAREALDLGLAHTRRRIGELAERLVTRLRGVCGGAPLWCGGGIVGLGLAEPDADRLARQLWELGIHVSCLGPRHAPLSLAAGRGVLRLSVHVCNEPAEIDFAAEQVGRLLPQHHPALAS